jgi:uncharacterized membrane protein YraQ (UPF0718 family)
VFASLVLSAPSALTRLRAWAPAGLVVGAAGVLLATEPGDAVTTFTTVFLGVFFEALPFLLVGVLVSAAIQAFVAPTLVQRLVPAGRLRGALTGALIGAAFPVCECGVVPVARRLLDKGASLPVALGFLLAGPVVNPVVFIATWTALGPEMATFRMLTSLLVAVAVAWLYGLHPRPENVLRWETLSPQPHLRAAGEAEKTGAMSAGAMNRAPTRPVVGAQFIAPTSDIVLPLSAHGSVPDARGGSPSAAFRITAVLGAAGDELIEMGRFLVLGAAAAAILRTLIPGPALVTAGQGPVLSVGLMMALAALLSICSVIDAFVALSLGGLVSSGAMLAFLVFGPVVDVKSVLLYGTIFRWRTVAMLALLMTQIVLLVGIAINLNVG